MTSTSEIEGLADLGEQHGWTDIRPLDATATELTCECGHTETIDSHNPHHPNSNRALRLHIAQMIVDAWYRKPEMMTVCSPDGSQAYDITVDEYRETVDNTTILGLRAELTKQTVPRLISTIAELQALPMLSVIITHEDQVAFQVYTGGRLRGTNTGETYISTITSGDGVLPAVLVFVPAAS